ncbi:unnamed protein product [Auanema sp. JU1783]|nr:unnamed protein product [Auanema sp. JU1783]
MGKGKNKNKEKESYSKNRSKKSDEEDYDSDASESTHLSFDSDMRSIQGDQLEAEAEAEEQEEKIIDALVEHIDNASHKTISIRVAAVRQLLAAFSRYYLPDFVSKWKVTLVDLATKFIKKTDDECSLGCNLLAQIALQTGNDISSLIEEPISLLRSIAADDTRSSVLRSRACLSIAVTSSLSCEDDVSIRENLKALKQCWSTKKLNSQDTTLFTLALPCWALMLREVDLNEVSAALSDYSKLTSFLGATQVENRIAAGETIAFIYELMREGSNPNYRFANHGQMIEVLDELASESSKVKSKKERRTLRYSFRQIHAYIVHDEAPNITIKFNKQNLVLDTCESKVIYDLCCEVLHGGMMHHLASNEILRDIFDLGPILETVEKVDKLSRLAFHDANTKNRNQVRGKQRDKRSVVY